MNTQDDQTKLEQFFLDSIKDIYWAEKYLTKALPKMQEASSSPKLAKAFVDHLNVTEMQVKRLEKVFELLEKKPQSRKCEAMEGIVKEGEQIISETEKGSATRDAGLIMAGQKVEHYEIASYGSLVQLAKTLGRSDIAKTLAETLGEEKEADSLLTTLAETGINEKADSE